ncbi:MAG: YihY/virulence factor BrkB family protein [Anaerolineales bacterium]
MQVIIMKQLRTAWRLIGETYNKYDQDNCATLAAALAFHSFFSIFPMLLFLIYIGSQVLQTEGVRELLSSGLIQFLPTGGDTISEVISATLDLRGSIGLVGGVGLLWNASSIFAVLETAMNRIWKSRRRPYWRTRLLATASILVLSLVFLASVTLGQFLPRLLALIDLPGLQWLGSLGSILILVLVLSVFYSTFPSRRVSRKAALGGAFAAGLSILAARVVFDIFINSTFANYGSVYGSLAWIVSLALWTFVVATLFLLGAEFGSILEADMTARRKAAG